VSVAVVLGFGVKAVGHREVRGLQVGASEAEPFWIELLRGVKLVASASRQAHDRGAGHFQKSTVAGVGCDLFLHSGVHDHPLQISLLDRTHGHRGFDGCTGDAQAGVAGLGVQSASAVSLAAAATTRAATCANEAGSRISRLSTRAGGALPSRL